jgi:hypothetical protein
MVRLPGVYPGRRTVRDPGYARSSADASAVYCPPGSDREVRIRKLAQHTMRHRYVGVLMVAGRPGRSLQTLGPGKLVIWAEGLVRAAAD